MNIALLSVISFSFYIAGTAYQLAVYLKKIPAKPFVVFFIGIVAVVSQAIITRDQLLADSGLDVSFFNSASLITCLAVSGLLIASIMKPLQTLLILAYPVACMSVVGVAIYDDKLATVSTLESGIFIHVVLSILSYAVFTLAAIQAVLVYIQNKNLKKHNSTLLMRNLPPLLTMESLLFEMLWIGMSLLTLAIAAGFIFLDDLFGQKVAHKTFFSLAAWVTFSILLVGRLRFGWRGITASKWTLWGSALLVLGFFGSKFVLEILLD